MTLQEFRTHAGLTLAELGRKIGVSAAAISRYEQKLRVPRFKTMLKIRTVTKGAVGLDDWD